MLRFVVVLSLVSVVLSATTNTTKRAPTCDITESKYLEGAKVTCELSADGKRVDACVTGKLTVPLKNSADNIEEKVLFLSSKYDCAGTNNLGKKRCTPTPAEAGAELTVCVAPSTEQSGTITYILNSGDGVEIAKFTGSI